jgi:two-component system sensor histidine kinase/response regulator
MNAIPSPDDLLAALMDQLPEGVCFKDRQGRYLRVNRTLAAWLGLKDPADAVGRSTADYFGREIAKAVAETEREVVEGGRTLSGIEEKRVWPDGRVMWMAASRYPIRDAAGAVVATMSVFRDIGPDLQAKQDVRRAELLYRNLVDNLPQSFFRKDLEGRVVYANRRYCEILGRPLKQLLGKTDYDLFPEKLARKYREDDARVLQTGIPIDVVEAHQPPGGKLIHVRVVKSPVYDADQRPIEVQGIFWEVPSASAAASRPPARKARRRKAPAAARPKGRRRKS